MAINKNVWWNYKHNFINLPDQTSHSAKSQSLQKPEKARKETTLIIEIHDKIIQKKLKLEKGWIANKHGFNFE